MLHPALMIESALLSPGEDAGGGNFEVMLCRPSGRRSRRKRWPTRAASRSSPGELAVQAMVEVYMGELEEPNARGSLPGDEMTGQVREDAADALAAE